MGNLRVYELAWVNYDVASGGYIMVDGSNYTDAKKFTVSSFALKSDVNTKFDTLNSSARKIVTELADVKSKIPTIETGTHNNINVDFNNSTKVYTFSATAYNVVTNSDDVLKITTGQGSNQSEVKYTLSANTYTKSYIDGEINKLMDRDVKGGNNVNVTRILNANGGKTNQFNVSLSGITAVEGGGSIVSNKSVVIGTYESNTALTTSFAQGDNNYASGNAFSQGDSNYSYNNAFAQGTNNSAKDKSFAQGYGTYAEHISLAQGYCSSAFNVSLSNGKYTYAKDCSVALGINAEASGNSIAFGYGYGTNDTHPYAYNNSVAIGGYASARNHSYSLMGNSDVRDYSFSVGDNGLVSGNVTALGNYNESKYINGSNPYCFAIGDGQSNNQHTLFRVDRNGVFYKRGNEEINLTDKAEKKTIVCTYNEYTATNGKYRQNGKLKSDYKDKVFIVG